MKKIFNQLSCWLSILGIMLACPSFANQLTSAASEVELLNNGYVRAMAPGQSVTAAYLQMVNQGKKRHQIIAVTSDSANLVQMHITKIDRNGISTMHRLKQINLAAHKKIAMTPGHLHIMLIGLKHPLKNGDKTNLTIIYEDGSWTKLPLKVKTS